MDTIPNHLPQTDGWASTTLAQRYEQEVCNILAALGEINEGIKYSLVTDLTRFKDFSYNPHRPLNKKALNKVRAGGCVAPPKKAANHSFKSGGGSGTGVSVFRCNNGCFTRFSPNCFGQDGATWNGQGHPPSG